MPDYRLAKRSRSMIFKVIFAFVLGASMLWLTTGSVNLVIFVPGFVVFGPIGVLIDRRLHGRLGGTDRQIPS